MSTLRVALILVAIAAPTVALAQQQELTVTSPDGKRILSAKDKVLSVSDVATQKLVMKIQGHTKDITGIGFSPDGKMLGSVDQGGSLKLFDAATGKETLSIQTGVGGGLSFGGDGKTVKVKSGDTAKTFDLATGKEVK
jgi:WD40 repeat protein